MVNPNVPGSAIPSPEIIVAGESGVRMPELTLMLNIDIELEPLEYT